MKSNIESSMQKFIQRRIDEGKPITEEQKKLIELAKKNLETIDHVSLDVKTSTTTTHSIHKSSTPLVTSTLHNHKNNNGKNTVIHTQGKNSGKFKKEKGGGNKKNKKGGGGAVNNDNISLEKRISMGLTTKR